jgi:type VI secretion system secreted protein Hcp
MDLILLRPGDPDLIADGGTSPAGLELDIPGPFIELVSVHHGMKQQITADVSNSARTSGRPIVTEFTCVKYVDATSVKLFDHCLRAKPLSQDKQNPTTIYIMRKSGDKTTLTLTIALRDALISEIQFQSHPADMPTEQFKLNFTEILWTHDTQAPMGWSLARNRPIAQFT